VLSGWGRLVGFFFFAAGMILHKLSPQPRILSFGRPQSHSGARLPRPQRPRLAHLFFQFFVAVFPNIRPLLSWRFWLAPQSPRPSFITRRRAFFRADPLLNGVAPPNLYGGPLEEAPAWEGWAYRADSAAWLAGNSLNRAFAFPPPPAIAFPAWPNPWSRAPEASASNGLRGASAVR